MILEQLSAGEVSRRLAGDGLALRTGPFGIRVRSDLPAVGEALTLLYGRHAVVPDDAFCDATLAIVRPRGLRRWLRPQVQLSYDHRRVFEPLPADQAFPLLEWSMNWWVSTHAHQYLILHAAVIARDGLAAILPAPPGSGKSTLCAGLVNRGWRLLSDELALVTPATGALHGLARPISLKNASLGVIRDYVAGAVFSRPVTDTAKGTVAHLRPGADDVARVAEPARPRWIVYPRYVPDAPPVLVARPKADAMMELGANAFNYALLGRTGFETLGDLVSACDSYAFSYSRLDDAVRVFDDLHAGRAGG